MTFGTFTPKAVNVKSVGHATSSGPESEHLRLKIIKLMTDASTNSARSLQTAIGPSEIGHPCPRQIALKVAGVTKNPSYLDPMPSILGTAAHMWMESVLPGDEWIPEQRVNVAPGLSGNSDAYHIPTQTVVDWKFLGQTQHRAWTGGYTSEQYEVQADSYGQGFVNAGYPVKRVAIAVFCRSKPLQDLFVWSKPWDPANAQKAINRLGQIRMFVTASGASNENRAPLQLVPAVAGDSCYFCSYKGTAAQGLCDRS